MARRLVAYFMVLFLVGSWMPGKALAAAPVLDWSIPNGHLFTESNGFPSGSSPMGFSIVDDSQAKFWTAYQSLGGVSRLGYPASRRFVWDGFVTQVTQKAVLQWRPESSSVDFVNVFDDLGRKGKDGWLLSERSIPSSVGTNFDAGLTWPQVVAHHEELLKARPALLKAYQSTPDALDLYGLPMSPVYDAGPMYVVRLQRAVLQEWKVKQPWADIGQVTVANGGDVAKEAGSVPFDQMRPIAVAVDTWPTTNFVLDGIASWYGPGFAGKPMANGQIYQPNDPTTTAANAFPLGSVLRVTSTVTKKSIVVTVRDTGSFQYPRVTDLSPAAFSSLGLSTATGITAVTVDLLTQPALVQPGSGSLVAPTPSPMPKPVASPVGAATAGRLTSKTQAAPA